MSKCWREIVDAQMAEIKTMGPSDLIWSDLYVLGNGL